MRGRKVVVHETYCMLGKQHEADLEREVRKFHLAAAVRPSGPGPPTTRVAVKISRRTWGFVCSRLAALFR